MTDISISLLIQSLGVLGVIGSLIFVGIEVKQNSVAVRAASNSTVAEAFRELNLVMASNTDLARALAAAGQDPTTLSLQDRVIVLAFWRALFHVWSNGHRQHLNGTLDPALWESVVQEMSVYGGKAGTDHIDQMDGRRRMARWAWESERFVYNPDFQAFFDDLLGIERKPGDSLTP